MECLLKAQREGDAYVKDVYEKASNVLEVLLNSTSGVSRSFTILIKSFLKTSRNTLKSMPN